MTNNQQQAVELDACKAAFEAWNQDAGKELVQAASGKWYIDKDASLASGAWRAAWKARGEYEATKGDAEGRVKAEAALRYLFQVGYNVGHSDAILHRPFNENAGQEYAIFETREPEASTLRALRPQPAAQGDGVERLVAAATQASGLLERYVPRDFPNKQSVIDNENFQAVKELNLSLVEYRQHAAKEQADPAMLVSAQVAYLGDDRVGIANQLLRLAKRNSDKPGLAMYLRVAANVLMRADAALAALQQAKGQGGSHE